MTLAKIIDTLKMIALKHPNVNSAYEGNIYDILNAKPDNRYASVVITQQSHTTDEIYDHYGFVIFYVDRLVDDLEENRVEIQSIGKSMLGNIITAFCNEFDAECDNISYQTFTQRFADETAGVYCTITIDTVKDVYCAERYWDESWSAPIVSIKNVDMSITITENGHYVLEYDPTTHTGIGKVDIDVDFNTEPYYNDGYGKGYNDGVSEQKSKLESINITENGTYSREDGYNTITVEVADLNGSYDEGYKDGYDEGLEEGVSNAGSVIAETARVLDITENGIYGSQYSDPINPNVITGDFGDGNYFYDWATITNNSYFTDAYVSNNSKIEVWWKSLNMFNGDGFYLIVGAGSDGNFQIRTNSNGSGFWFEIGGERVTYNTLVPNEWYHIVLSAEGAYINGEKCGEFSNPYDFGERQVCINAAPYIDTAGRFANGTIGMVKVDDHIYIPTQDGFINYHTKEIMEEKHSYGTYDFTENPIIYFDGNLIKTVNVNVPPQIYLNTNKICLAYSSFVEMPNGLVSWSDVTDMTNMFRECVSLQKLNVESKDVNSLRYAFYNCRNLSELTIDTSNVKDMGYAFSLCKELSSEFFASLNTSNVTNMESAFSNTSIVEFKLDTSNVTNMYGLFQGATTLKKVHPINTSKVTDMSYMFYDFSSTFALEELPEFDCTNVTKIGSMFSYYQDRMPNFTTCGGWKNLKIDWNDNYGLRCCANLSYESCINILNGLYDFRGNGDSSTTRKLKVHQNFLDKVGDKVSIATEKGWLIQA